MATSWRVSAYLIIAASDVEVSFRASRKYTDNCFFRKTLCNFLFSYLLRRPTRNTFSHWWHRTLCPIFWRLSLAVWLHCGHCTVTISAFFCSEAAAGCPSVSIWDSSCFSCRTLGSGKSRSNRSIKDMGVTPSASAKKLVNIRCRITGTATARTSEMETLARPRITARAFAPSTRY